MKLLKPFTFQLSTFNSRSGFTLIELIVVIAIIGILAGGATLININGQLGKGRDAKRKGDLAKIATLLEQYYSDNGRYPPCGGGCNCGSGTYRLSTEAQPWIPELAPYASQLPTDPLNTGTWPVWEIGQPGSGYTYAYRVSEPDGQYYDLIAQLENHEDLQRCNVGVVQKYRTCGGGGTGSWNCTGPPNVSRYLYDIPQ